MKNTFAAIKFWMDKILSIACAVLLTFMTVLVLIQVFSRYILNSPVAFTEELVRYSLIWTGFIGAAYAFSTREHMSLTLIRDKFTGKAHTALLVVIDGLILLMAILAIVGAFLQGDGRWLHWLAGLPPMRLGCRGKCPCRPARTSVCARPEGGRCRCWGLPDWPAT